MGHPRACTRTWHSSVFHLFCDCQFCLRSSVSRLCGASNSGIRLSSVRSTDKIQLILTLFWVFQNVSHCQQQSYSGTRLPRWSFSTYLWNDPWVPVWKTSMEFHGFPWKILHGIPWRIRTSISMEFHGNFSIDFHGKYLHGGLGHFPWNSMENIRAPISMEFHGNFCIDIFDGGLWHFLWNSMETFHAIP